MCKPETTPKYFIDGRMMVEDTDLFVVAKATILVVWPPVLVAW